MLVYALSAPFWVVNYVHGTSGLPDNIPLTDIGATLSPMIAACIIISWEGGRAGLLGLLGRVFDWQREARWRWWLAASLLVPGL